MHNLRLFLLWCAKNKHVKQCIFITIKSSWSMLILHSSVFKVIEKKRKLFLFTFYPRGDQHVMFVNQKQICRKLLWNQFSCLEKAWNTYFQVHWLLVFKPQQFPSEPEPNTLIWHGGHLHRKSRQIFTISNTKWLWHEQCFFASIRVWVKRKRLLPSWASFTIFSFHKSFLVSGPKITVMKYRVDRQFLWLFFTPNKLVALCIFRGGKIRNTKEAAASTIFSTDT